MLNFFSFVSMFCLLICGDFLAADAPKQSTFQCKNASSTPLNGDASAYIGARRPAFIMIQNEPFSTLGASTPAANFFKLQKLIEEGAAQKDRSEVEADYLRAIASLLELDQKALQLQAVDDADSLRDVLCANNRFLIDYAIVSNRQSEVKFDTETGMLKLTKQIHYCTSRDNPKMTSKPKRSVDSFSKTHNHIFNKQELSLPAIGQLAFTVGNYSGFNSFYSVFSSQNQTIFPIQEMIVESLMKNFPQNEYYYVFYMSGSGDESHVFSPDFSINFDSVTAGKVAEILLEGKIKDLPVNDIQIAAKADVLAALFPFRAHAETIKSLLREKLIDHSFSMPADLKDSETGDKYLDRHRFLTKGSFLRLLIRELSGHDVEKSTRIPLIVLDTPRAELSLTKDSELSAVVSADSYENLHFSSAGKICTRMVTGQHYNTLDFKKFSAPFGVDTKKVRFDQFLEEMLLKPKSL